MNPKSSPGHNASGHFRSSGLRALEYYFFVLIGHYFVSGLRFEIGSGASEHVWTAWIIGITGINGFIGLGFRV